MKPINKANKSNVFDLLGELVEWNWWFDWFRRECRAAEWNFLKRNGMNGAAQRAGAPAITNSFNKEKGAKLIHQFNFIKLISFIGFFSLFSFIGWPGAPLRENENIPFHSIYSFSWASQLAFQQIQSLHSIQKSKEFWLLIEEEDWFASFTGIISIWWIKLKVSFLF